MQEDLIHYLWQYQAFARYKLTTTTGEDITILSVGTHNYDAGPDFSGARLRIDTVLWSGAVEIHIRASDWQRHKHHLDEAYNHVILHVVWENDGPAYRSDGTLLPVLELRPLVDLQTIRQYQQYFQQGYQQERKLLCAAHFHQVDHLTVVSAMERALVSRMQQKAQEVLLLLDANQGDWQTTTFQWLCKGYGFKKNAAPMLALSQSVPLSLIRKHQASMIEMEALLMGQAGFLAYDSDDAHWKTLRETYSFLNHKFQLDDQHPGLAWKFARMRPANFPTMRLAQLTAFLHQYAHELDILLSVDEPDIQKIFRHEPSSFWHTHYHPQRQSLAKQHTIGVESMHNLAINVICPLQYAYAMYYQDMERAEKVFALLQKLPAEKNSIVNMYKSVGFPITSAYDTQAVLGLQHALCQHHRCLSCGIGNKILNNQLANSTHTR